MFAATSLIHCAPMNPMKYQNARGLLLATGLTIIGLMAATMWLRGVDPIEIIATLMYAPLFAGLIFFGFSAGTLLGIVAALVYIVLRMPALELVGIAPLAGTVISRVVGYIAFGSLGGWASQQIKVALDRFQLIDELDEESGLGNARAAHNAIERETNRAKRYGHTFSVVSATFDDLGADRRAHATLRDVGTKVGLSIRTSDYATHMRTPDGHEVVIVLPETGEAGAETVKTNLDTLIRLVIGGEVTLSAVTDDGGDEDPLALLKLRLASAP